MVVLVLLSMANITQAAQAEQEPSSGHIPVLQVGPGVRMASIPFDYAYDAGAFGASRHTESQFAASFGFDARLRLDLDAAIAYIDGYYALTGSGVHSMLRGGVVLARGFGGRSTHPYTEYGGATDTVEGDTVYRTETYIQHADLQLPVVYGLTAGLTVTNVAATRFEASGLDPGSTRGAAALISPEIGFGVIAGQYEAFAAPFIELNGMDPGLRWSIDYGFPVSRFPLYCYLGGNYYSGDSNRAISYEHFVGLGLGTSVGVSP